MQRVGFQRFARGFLRHLAQGAGAQEVDDDGGDDHDKGRERCFHRMALRHDQAPHRFPDHDAGKDEEQGRLGQCRDALHLAVAIVMFLIRRLAGDAHGEIGHDRRDEVDQRVAGFRQHGERARHHADDGLGNRQPCRSEHRRERDPFLDILHADGVSEAMQRRQCRLNLVVVRRSVSSRRRKASCLRQRAGGAGGPLPARIFWMAAAMSCRSS